MAIIQFSVGDQIVMKKMHPCGKDIFKVARCGSDVRIVCTGCGRDLTIDREKIEKSIRRVIPKTTNEET